MPQSTTQFIDPLKTQLRPKKLPVREVGRKGGVIRERQRGIRTHFKALPPPSPRGRLPAELVSEQGSSESLPLGDGAGRGISFEGTSAARPTFEAFQLWPGEDRGGFLASEERLRVPSRQIPLPERSRWEGFLNEG